MAVIAIALFILAYLIIALEHKVQINKAATALVAGVLCWTVYILFTPDKAGVVSELAHHLGELSQILFFLLGAMTIVELIDAHDGFNIITTRITTRNKRKLLWIIGAITFFLSAALDNLTTAIVMVSLVRKLIPDKEDRLLFIGLIVLSANAGGAWSPIGDVTTTMLWIGGQITAMKTVLQLILPSLVCFIIPVLLLQFFVKGDLPQTSVDTNTESDVPVKRTHRNIVFFSGLAALLFVPIFKTITHLPPFMAMMLSLGILWMIVEFLHRNHTDERKAFSVSSVLRNIDTPSILFFLGILLAVAALDAMGQLKIMSMALDNNIKDTNVVVLLIGLLSSVIDNVPLVAASMGMYDLQRFPQDHSFWLFLAYCSGTGGSILIIGSAAGVAAMGLEKISFGWYLKRISWIALAGYIGGALVYMAMN